MKYKEKYKKVRKEFHVGVLLMRILDSFQPLRIVLYGNVPIIT